MTEEEKKELLEVVLSWVRDGCPEDEKEAAIGTLEYVIHS